MKRLLAAKLSLGAWSPSIPRRVNSVSIWNRLGDELWSGVGPDVNGNVLQDEEVGRRLDHIDRLELAADTDRQAFMGELVERVEHPILASLVGAVLDKVVGPDVIA